MARGLYLRLFGIFDRSADLRQFDQALRAGDLLRCPDLGQCTTSRIA